MFAKPKSGISEYIANKPKAKRESRINFDIVEFLKKNSEEVYTWQELCQLLKITPPNSVLDSLKQNPKVETFPDGRLAYKPTYSVKSKEELRELMQRSPNGIDLRELQDAYKEVHDDLKELQNEKQIYIIKNAENFSDIIFPNDLSLPPIQVGDIFKSLWNEVHIPDVVELERQMISAKLKVIPDSNPIYKRSSEKKEPKKRKQKKIKYHNTHVMSDGISVVDDD